MSKFCIYDYQVNVIKEALTNGGKKEIEAALNVLEEVKNLYALVGITKEDIADKAFNDIKKADLIEDNMIEEIAEDMGSAYLESGYWIDLEVMIDYKEIRSLDKS